MACNSMTGFGTAAQLWESSRGPAWVQVEVRSVNGRHLEVRLRQPFGAPTEHALRSQVEQRLGRGRVEVSVTLGAGGPGAAQELPGGLGVPAVSVPEVVQALAQIEAVAREAKLELAPANAADILRILMAPIKREGSENRAIEPPPWLPQLTAKALDELCRFRAQEGEALGAALAIQVRSLASLSEALAEEARSEPSRSAGRLRSRIDEICAGLGHPAPSPDRLAQEVALWAAKGDVTEELARIASHLARFDETLTAAPSPRQGRVLEFIAQELVREFTTVGSKLTTQAASARVIEAKAALERVREQVQNVE